MVIQTGSPLLLASTIFCFRRWSQIRDFVTFDFVTLSTFVLEGSQSL